MANIPSTEWDTMIDCLEDWIDENDLHGLNGAESDDPFYQERGYPVKNGPLDSVEELLLVKGWGPEILYGRPPDEENDEIFFLLRQRHHDVDDPPPVAFSSESAEPMRRALSGESGTVIDLDYRDVIVLAAYEPVVIEGQSPIGIVAKIDMKEI